MADVPKAIPSVIDSRYFVVNQLGHGFQGQVFKVQSLSEPGRYYALKLIDIKEKNSKIIKKIENYIRSEFSLLKSLNHQNIVKVFDFGFDPLLKSYYFTMEFLDGLSLYNFFRQDNTTQLFPEIVRQILNGLHFLHANKIIHYDINPTNIIIIEQSGTFMIKLLDFGLAEINQLNRHARIKKNILYISPELYTHSAEVTERIDIYSLGVSLLHSLCKEIELDLSQLSDIDFKTTDKRVFDHKFLLSSLPTEKIRRFITGMIERNPKLRPANAEEALHNLNSIFGTSFPLAQIAIHESFQKNSRFLIRNDVVNLVINYFCNYRAAVKKNTIVIAGDAGSGKSRVAEQLHFNFSCMFYKTLLLNNTSSQKLFGVIISLIDQIYLISSPYLKTDMQSFYSLLNQINRNIRKSSHYQTLFKQIFDFLQESCTLRQITVIFDEYEKYDLYSQQFIQYLVLNARQIQLNIIVLFGTTGLGKREEEILDFFKNSGRAEFLRLNPLSIQDIRYVRHFLLGKAESFPPDFEELLHQAGGSNFARLMLIFDNLLSYKAIKKQDGIYQLDNRSRMLKVIKMSEERLSVAVLRKLHQDELEVLLLLALAETQLSEEKISQLLKRPLPAVHQSIIQLDKSRLIVGLKKDQLFLEYRPYTSDIIFSLLQISDKNRIIATLTLLKSAAQLDKITTQLTNLLKLHDFSANQITELLETVIDQNKMLFYLEIIEKMLPGHKAAEAEIKAVLLIYKIQSQQTVGSSSIAYRLYSRLDKLFSQLQNSSLITLIVRKEIDFFNIQSKYTRSAALMLKHSHLLLSESQAKDFFDRYFNLYRLTLNSGLKKNGRNIASDIEQLLSSPINKFNPEPFRVLLFTYRILSREIAFNQNYMAEIEKAIIRLQKSNDDRIYLFDLYTNYVSICRSYDQEMHADWGKWLKEALDNAGKLNLPGYFTRMSNLLFVYYRSISDYRNALSIVKKMIAIAKENNHAELPGYYINQAILKTDLLYPLSEITAAKKEGFELARLNNHYSYYVQCSISLCQSYIFNGDFSTALYYWQESYDFFRYCPLKDIRIFIDAFTESGLLLTGIDSIKARIDNLYTKKLLDRDDYNYAIQQINYYNEQFTAKSSYTDEKGTALMPTVHTINLPGLLLTTIIKNKKLPSRQEFSTIIDKKFINKPFFRVVSNMIKYMLSPDDHLLEKNYLTLKKVYQLGYEMDIFFNLVPFLEYLYIIKNTSTQTTLLIDLLKEIINSLFSRMQEDQKLYFMQIYEFKRTEKTLARFAVLLNNSVHHKN